MKEQLIDHILRRLERDETELREDFNRDRGLPTRFTAIDDLFPEDVARSIYSAFPKTDEMRLLDSFREKKYTSKSLDKFDKLVSDVTLAFQDERVINAVVRITGHKDPVGDPSLYAGGISAMKKGHFLNPHIDNSHDFEQKNYRVLNLLYYCTPGWTAENGGNFELWDTSVTKRTEIPSFFNRLVLMETNERSWHSVNEVKADAVRCCVSNYYFSPHSPNGHETAHVTFFQARPEQKIRRIVTLADGYLRTAARKFLTKGFSKKDLYDGGKPDSASNSN